MALEFDRKDFVIHKFLCPLPEVIFTVELGEKCTSLTNSRENCWTREAGWKCLLGGIVI